MTFQDVFRSLEDTIAQQVHLRATELHNIWAAEQEKKLDALAERLQQQFATDLAAILAEIVPLREAAASRAGEAVCSESGNVSIQTPTLQRQITPRSPTTSPDTKLAFSAEEGATSVSLATSGGLKLPVEKRGAPEPDQPRTSLEDPDGRGERREAAPSHAIVAVGAAPSPTVVVEASKFAFSMSNYLAPAIKSKTTTALRSPSVRFEDQPVLTGPDTPPRRNTLHSGSTFLRRSRTMSVTSTPLEFEEDRDWELPTVTGYGISSQLHNKTLWKMFAGLLVVVAGFIAALYVYPFFTLAAILCIVMWVFYLFAEEPLIIIMSKWNMKWIVKALRYGQSMRAKHEMEVRVQSGLTSACMGILALNPDIGALRYLFRTLPKYAALPLLILVMLGVLYLSGSIVHVFHEHSARAVRWNKRRHSSGCESPRGGSVAVVEILEVIKKGLKETGTKQKRKIEKDIYEMVESTDTRTLNDLLVRMSKSRECSLLRLLRHCKDTPERASRKELIELMCTERADELTVKAKSAVLHALMSLNELGGSESMQNAVESLLFSVKGDDLSDLKSMQDGGGDVNSMHKLVFQDLAQPDRSSLSGARNRLLDHFLCEGLAQVAHRDLMASDHFVEMLKQGVIRECVPPSLDLVKKSVVEQVDCFGDVTPGGTHVRRGGGPRYDGQDASHNWVKILFDIDDTFQCSGAGWPAGIDGRYSKHTTYPGVLAFFRELQSGGGPLPPGVTSQLVALSARPHIPGDYMEQRVFARFRHLMENNCLYAMPALLTGSLDTSLEFLAGDLAALGKKKLQGFEQYMMLYPEFRFIFIGDNGQADYAVGQMMCRKFPCSVEQVWIHEVQPREKTFLYDLESDAPVDFFSDYIAAAVSAATRPKALITPEGLVRVANAAVSDFSRIVHEGGVDQANREQEATRLSASIERARKALRELGAPHLSEDLSLIEGVVEAPRPSVRFSVQADGAKFATEVQVQEVAEVKDGDESPITAAVNAEQRESLGDFARNAESFLSLPGAASDEESDKSTH